MINRSNTFGEEVADQVGVFLSIVTGFIVAQAWNTAFKDMSERHHKSEFNEDWFWWVYALIATIVALCIMTLWGYYIASRFHHPDSISVELRGFLQKLARLQKQNFEQTKNVVKTVNRK